ncbi:uncharacterized [Tachysurus ichikawai]
MPSLHRTNDQQRLQIYSSTHTAEPQLGLWSHVEPLDEARRGETALKGLQRENKVLDKQAVQHDGSGSTFNGRVGRSVHSRVMTHKI